MMRERAGRLGAALDIRSAASGGTEVEVVVP
jgi:nitrate/nitrite-specific signal transduction histidine kinase